MCGDRPLAYATLSVVHKGSPVCAGIDPSYTATPNPRTGFPRVCGDRPSAEEDDSRLLQVPPCVRG